MTAQTEDLRKYRDYMEKFLSSNKWNIFWKDDDQKSVITTDEDYRQMRDAKNRHKGCEWEYSKNGLRSMDSPLLPVDLSPNSGTQPTLEERLAAARIKQEEVRLKNTEDRKRLPPHDPRDPKEPRTS